MSPRWPRRVALLAAALWWGSLSTLGLGVVPLLFVHLPTPAMAGQMAAKLFAWQAWVSVICTLVLGVVVLRCRQKSKQNNDFRPANWTKFALFFIVIGLALAVANQALVAPRIVARVDLQLWHSLGSGLYLLQWLASTALLLSFEQGFRSDCAS